MADYDSIGGGASGAVSGATSGIMAGAGLAKAGMVAGPVGMIVGGLLGAVFGSKKKKVQKPPTYSELMNNNLTAQEGIQNRLIDLEGKYRPKYQGLQEKTLNTQLYGGQGTQGYVNMLNQANTALAGVQQNAANTYMDTLGSLTGRSRNLIAPQKVQTMQDMLFAQAQGELDAGTNLNAQDQRMAFQNANMGMAQRGLTGRQGVAAGVLANYGLGLQRQDRARQFAGQVMSSEMGLQSQALQLAGNTMAQYNAGGAFMGQANAMLGQYQPQIFQPESQMGTQAQGMQYQHNAAMARASLQNYQNAISSVGQFGAFMAQNPKLFDFGSTTSPTSGTWTFDSKGSPLSVTGEMGSGNFVQFDKYGYPIKQ